MRWHNQRRRGRPVGVPFGVVGLLWLVAAVSPGWAEVGEVKRVEPAAAICFTDGWVEVGPAAADGEAGGNASVKVRVLTRAGWSDSVDATAVAVDGRWRVAPLREGLHVAVVRPRGPGPGAGAEPFEVRFLAMDPPAAVDRDALAQALPLTHGRLFDGERPYRIAAMGDSVTATGDYPQMLAMMLGRATGHPQIEVVKHAHPGRSVDATVRNWDREVGREGGVDLGLLMYGLNDEGAGVELGTYLEQYRWVAARLRGVGADAVWLEPTPELPDLEEAAAADAGDVERWPAVLRTLRFGAALHDPPPRDKSPIDRAAPLPAVPPIPVAPMFAAVWGDGGPEPGATIRGLWPLYPQHYTRPFSTILDTGGEGDRIHPNALGHLAIARAVYHRLTQPPRPLPATPPGGTPLFGGTFSASGTTAWEDGRVVSRLSLQNLGDHPRHGTVRLVAPAGSTFDVAAPSYSLAPGETASWALTWPGVFKPMDLLNEPVRRHLASATPRVDVLATEGERSSVASPPLPWTHGASFVRFVGEGRDLPEAIWRKGDETHRVPVMLLDQEAGRVPLTVEAEPGQWLAAELFYVRYAGALPGEATVDGRLDEWAEHVWRSVGLPVQAWGPRGPAEHTPLPADGGLRFTAKVGTNHLYVAMKVQSDIHGDRFTLWFDPRAPDRLGRVGGYFWVEAALQPDGQVELRPGETTDAAALPPTGTWHAHDDGTAAVELAIPYATFGRAAFPGSGDLGFSLAWRHTDPRGQTTVLQWSDRGHPWTPVGFGVLRLQATPDAATLPYRVRVR